MDDNQKKKIVSSLVLSSLGAAAYYLLKDDFKEIAEIVKEPLKENAPILKKEPQKKEKKDFWSGMTWDKLRTLLGSKLRNENIMEAYYLMNEQDKINWRRAVYRKPESSLDRAFVYLDSRVISQVYSSESKLREVVGKYARNRVNFDKLYQVYRQSLRRLFGIG